MSRTDGRVVLATRSAGKLRELRVLFAAAQIAVIDLDEAGVAAAAAEAAIESGATFEENALLKARYYAARVGGPVIADDSGLAVTALGGRPGIHSKRWSGRDDLSGAALDAANNEQLLKALAGRRDRGARYVCAAAYVDGDVAWVVRGECAGEILESPRGVVGRGFGYDPYFYATELGMTFAEAPLEAKASVSHRGRAFAALIGRLGGSGGGVSGGVAGSD